jgi:methylmalonyl-CoA/ethylmalonyl-CoA epimerase
MSQVRRLDHIAIAVHDSARAAAELSERLGVRPVHTEDLSHPNVRLTYLDAGNCFIQLIQPLSLDTDIARWLTQHGEGVHHVCFGVDDVARSVAEIAGLQSPPPLGSGRGRASAFVPGEIRGVRIECTKFLRDEDVEGSQGWLAD